LNERKLNSEPDLVRSLKRSDIQAYESLYKLYSLRLYHFGLKYLKSETEAEGLVQDVFEKIWAKRESLKTELSFKSYIFTIAFNFIKKSLIKSSQLRDYLQSDQVFDEVDLATTNQVDYQSLIDYLNSLIKKLPEKRREIFIKSRMEDLPVKEIARQLDISPKTVENQLTIATKFIKANWEHHNLSTILFLGLFVFRNL